MPKLWGGKSSTWWTARWTTAAPTGDGPPASLRQMGVDSLTPATARVLVSVEREPVVTVSFRRRDSREVVACRGDGQILEEASLNGGRFTLMCTTSAGAQRPIQVGNDLGP